MYIYLMKTITLEIQDFWKETRTKITKSKKQYSRKKKHKNANNCRD